MGESKNILIEQEKANAFWDDMQDWQEKSWQEHEFQEWLKSENLRDCEETRRLWRQNGWKAI